jgi:integrase
MTFDSRIRRRLTKLGIDKRLEIDSGATERRQHIAAERVVDKLIDDRQRDVLQALMDKRVTLGELVDSDRKGTLGGANALVSVEMGRPLFESWEVAIKKMDCSQLTKLRYSISCKALEKRAGLWLTRQSTIADLRTVPWDVLRKVWLASKSGTDWMHMRRGLSHFLTVTFRSRYHPLRAEVLFAMKPAKERKRMPDLSVETFWKVVNRVREDLRPAYVTIAGLGLRAGEYLSIGPDSFNESTLQLSITGKTGAATLLVPEELYGWVRAACPALASYKTLRSNWRTACKEEGVDITLHDLRHCTGQWATSAGVAMTKTQMLLRHSTLDMTARYAATRDKGEAASAVAELMLRTGSGR